MGDKALKRIRNILTILMTVMLIVCTIGLFACGNDEKKPEPQTPATYTITCESVFGATISASKSSAKAGEVITLTLLISSIFRSCK